jgi:UDP-N-acetylglucosamine acyltransferase
VTIGHGTKIENFAVIKSGTVIGENCRVFQGSVIGEIPQDLKFEGEKTKTIIGNNVTIREFVTINRGTSELGYTKVGSDVLLMAYIHIAHDCVVGNHVIMANQATLGGHVEIEDWVFLGGGVMVHQFCKIGQHSMVAAGFRAVQDVPPYITASGEPIKYSGLNSIGLKRRGFSADRRKLIKQIYSTYFRSGLPRRQALEKIKNQYSNTEIGTSIIKFIEKSHRGII